MAAVTAAASPGASLPQGAPLTSVLKPQSLADTFSTTGDAPLPGSPKIERLHSSELGLVAAHLGAAGGCADQHGSL